MDNYDAGLSGESRLGARIIPHIHQGRRESSPMVGARQACREHDSPRSIPPFPV